MLQHIHISPTTISQSCEIISYCNKQYLLGNMICIKHIFKSSKLIIILACSSKLKLSSVKNMSKDWIGYFPSSKSETFHTERSTNMSLFNKDTQNSRNIKCTITLSKPCWNNQFPSPCWVFSCWIFLLPTYEFFAVTLKKQNIFSYILKTFSWHGRKNILFHQQLWWVCSPSNIRFNPQSHTWMADENKEMLLGFTISNAIKKHII